MLCHGDELGGTQVGNNNVYCQDSELGWIDWDAARDSEALTRFTAQLVRLRAEHPLFRRRHFFDGRPVGDAGSTDVAWFRRDGAPMIQADWATDTVEALTVFLNGHGIPEPDALGEAIVDDSFLLLFNPCRIPSHSPCPTVRTANPGRSSSTPLTHCSRPRVATPASNPATRSTLRLRRSSSSRTSTSRNAGLTADPPDPLAWSGGGFR